MLTQLTFFSFTCCAFAASHKWALSIYSIIQSLNWCLSNPLSKNQVDAAIAKATAPSRSRHLTLVAVILLPENDNQTLVFSDCGKISNLISAPTFSKRGFS